MRPGDPAGGTLPARRALQSKELAKVMDLKHLTCLAASVLLAACNWGVEGPAEDAPSQAASPAAKAIDESLVFRPQPDGPEPIPAVSPVFRAQVILDRLGFSPRLIDGSGGPFFSLALRGFQQANELPRTGELDEQTVAALGRWQGIPATARVVIPEGFARGPFDPGLPPDLAAQAKFDRLGYRSMTEALAERFHTTPDILVGLNGDGTYLAAGRSVRVPNVASADPAKLGEDTRGWNRTLQLLGVAPDQPEAARILVDESEGALLVFGPRDRLLAQFPVTTGSSHDPLPIGSWKIKGVARNPDFQYNPDLFWDASAKDKAARLPPGPNGPVGVVWIDLSKPHYGIHGTPEPQNIGHTESHGCVRLTNWDAARLAQMTRPGTAVVFRR